MWKTASLTSFQKHGFTLIEVLIVVLLIGILAVAGVNGMAGMQRVSKLNEAHDKISGMIETARNYAVNGKQVRDFTDSNHDNKTDDQAVANAYGVYMQKDPYDEKIVAVLFADFNNKSKDKYNNSETKLDNSTTPAQDNSADYVIEYYEIPNNFELFLENYDNVTFLYYPPIGKFNMQVNQADTPKYPDSITTSICYQSCDVESNMRKTIKIYKNSSGLPEKS